MTDVVRGVGLEDAPVSAHHQLLDLDSWERAIMGGEFTTVCFAGIFRRGLDLVITALFSLSRLSNIPVFCYPLLL